MKSALLTLVLLLAAVVPASATPSVVTSSSVHLIGVDDTNGDGVACSGVVLAHLKQPGWSVILTARHCMENGVRMDDVYFFDGDVGHVAAYATDPYDDLGVLVVHSSRDHVTKYFLGNGDLHRGERLRVFGNTGELPWNDMPAVVINPVDQDMHDPDHPWGHLELLGCVGCAEGTSGAGVWDAQNELVGVVVAGASGGVTAIEGADRIEKFVKAIIAGDVHLQDND